MLEAAKRLADALHGGAAPGIRESLREGPRKVRDGLDLVAHEDAQHTGLNKLGRAVHPDTEPAASRESPDPSIADTTRWGDRDRSGISREEAQAAVEQARDREPNFAGTGHRLNLVYTSSGLAVVRFPLESPTVPRLKRWMPEDAAINHARECGVRTPEVFYAGTDSLTGRDFMITQFVAGETLRRDDPELLNWLPDLLNQVQLMSSRPSPVGPDLDIPRWQQQLIRHADGMYDGLSPEARSRLDRLGIGRLSDYFQPDLGRSGEPVVFAHNDLFPTNLRRDEQERLCILDWECAGPSDPLYDASFFLARLRGNVDDATIAQATDMWLERITPADSAVDARAALREYHAMEDWRAVAMCSETMPGTVAADPSRFERWVEQYDRRLSRSPELSLDIPKDELRTLLRGWLE